MAFRRDYVIQISGLKHDKITFIFHILIPLQVKHESTLPHTYVS